MKKIKLVVQIEEYYRDGIIRYRDGTYGAQLPFCVVNSALEAIANGTPLPKGHGRLIDIDNIESIMLEDSVNRMVHTKGDEVDWYIEAPTIIAADKESDNE